MALLTTKVQASSLIEVLIAMVILSIVMSIGIGTFHNVTSSNSLVQKQEAAHLLDSIFLQTKQTVRLIDEQIETANFTIQKEVVPYSKEADLHLLKLQVLDKEGKLIANKNELIYSPK